MLRVTVFTWRSKMGLGPLSFWRLFFHLSSVWTEKAGRRWEDGGGGHAAEAGVRRSDRAGAGEEGGRAAGGQEGGVQVLHLGAG